MLREQFLELIERLQNSSSPEMVQDVYDFIDSCGKYIDKVVAMEAVIITQDTLGWIRKSTWKLKKIDVNIKMGL